MSNTVSISELFAQHKKSRIAPLQEGEYELEVASAKAKGDQVVPTYTVLSGPYAGQKALAGQFSFGSENAASIAFQNLAGFGLDEQFFAQGASVEDIARVLVGRRVRAFVELRDFKGQPRNQFRIGAVQLISAPAAATVAGIPPVSPPTSVATPAAAPVPAAPGPQPAVQQTAPQPEAAAPTAIPPPAPQLLPTGVVAPEQQAVAPPPPPAPPESAGAVPPPPPPVPPAPEPGF